MLPFIYYIWSYILLVGIFNTLSLETRCSIAPKNLQAAGFETGSSSSTVRRSTICAISSLSTGWEPLLYSKNSLNLDEAK